MSAHSTAPAPAHRDAWMPPPPPSGLRLAPPPDHEPVVDVGALRKKAEGAMALEAEVASLRARVAELEAQIEEMTRPTLEDVRT